MIDDVENGGKELWCESILQYNLISEAGDGQIVNGLMCGIMNDKGSIEVQKDGSEEWQMASEF